MVVVEQQLVDLLLLDLLLVDLQLVDWLLVDWLLVDLQLEWLLDQELVEQGVEDDVLFFAWVLVADLLVDHQHQTDQILLVEEQLLHDQESVELCVEDHQY